MKQQAVIQRLGTIKQVAELLNISETQVKRLEDAGQMPRGIKLGFAKRWDLAGIEKWITQGCPTMEEEDGNDSRLRATAK